MHGVAVARALADFGGAGGPGPEQKRIETSTCTTY
jgi:hypothetical protein